MAVTDFYTFLDNEIRMRWREPYVTEGLNRKFEGVVPRGIWRGWHLQADSVISMQVKLIADAAKGDHVAVYNTTSGNYQLRVEKSGDVNIPVSAYAGTTIYIAIYATYSTLVTTAAVLRIYPEADYLAAPEKDELIVLGKVDVPASGIIPDGDVNPTATRAWEEQSSGILEWNPLGANPVFSQGAPAQVRATSSTNQYPWNETLPWWNIRLVAAGDAGFYLQTTDAYEGAQSLELRATADGSLTVTSFSLAIETSEWNLVEEGSLLKVQLFYKPLVAVVAGEITVRATFLDKEEAGFSDYTVDLGTLDLSVSASWVEFVKTIEAPAGYPILGEVFITRTASLDYGTLVGTPTSLLRIGAFQAWAQKTSPGEVPLADAGRAYPSTPSSITFYRKAPHFVDESYSMLYPNSILDEHGVLTNFVSMDRLDVDKAVKEQPVLQLKRLFIGNDGPTVDTDRLNRSCVHTYTKAGAGQFVPVIDVSETYSTRPVFSLYHEGDAYKFVVSVNCWFDNVTSQWYAKTSAESAFKLEVGATVTNPRSGEPIYGLVVREKSSTTSPWSDSAWNSSPSLVLPFELDDPGNDPEGLIGDIQGGIVFGEAIAALTSTVAAAADLPRIKTRRLHTKSYTLLFEMPEEDATKYGTRIYQASTGQVLVVTNARWSSVTSRWYPDRSGTNDIATMQVLGNGNVSTVTEPEGLAGYLNVDVDGITFFLDSEWYGANAMGLVSSAKFNASQYELDLYSGADPTAVLTIHGDGTPASRSRVTIDGSNLPYSSGPAVNSLFSSNIVKAWCHCNSDGVGGFSSVDGFNCVPSLPGGSELRFTFPTVLSSFEFVAVGSTDASQTFMFIDTQTTASVDTYWCSDTGTFRNPATEAYWFEILVIGKQT